MGAIFIRTTTLATVHQLYLEPHFLRFVIYVKSVMLNVMVIVNKIRESND